MSSRKEKRLKKLKKQRIWPYILGIFMVVVVFTILAAMMMGFFVVNVVYEKVQQGYDTSQLVAKIVAEEWDGTNSDSMNTVQEEISRLLPLPLHSILCSSLALNSSAFARTSS